MATPKVAKAMTTGREHIPGMPTASTTKKIETSSQMSKTGMWKNIYTSWTKHLSVFC